MSLPALNALPVARPATPGAGAEPAEPVAPESGFAVALESAVGEADALANEPLDTAVAEALPEAAAPAQPAPVEAALTSAPTANPAAPAAVAWPPPGLSALFPVAQASASTTVVPAEEAPPPALLSATQAPATSAVAANPALAAQVQLTGELPPRALRLANASASTIDTQALGLKADDSAEVLPLPAPITNAALAATQAAAQAAAASNASALLPNADAAAAALARTVVAQARPGGDASVSTFDASLSSVLDARGSDTASPLSSLSSGPGGLARVELPSALAAPVPLHTPRFAEEMATRVAWIAQQAGGEATLRISPEGMGPVDIRVSLDGDRIDLGFTAAQADTRAALENALPKLREMLQQQGLQLGHADVGQRHAQGSNASGDGPSERSAGTSSRTDDMANVAGVSGEIVVRVPTSRGLLDLYA